jgi:nucleotide-binding universal stress UspA family protein
MVQTTAEWPSIRFQNSTVAIAWPDYVAYLHRLLAEIATAVPTSLLYHEPEENGWQRPFALWRTQHLVARAKEAVLVVRQPRWPLQQILLVVRGQKGDETAFAWAEQLARASRAIVAILPVIPAWPAMYQKGNQVQASLDILLQLNTPSGHQLHQYQQRLEQAAVPHYFCQQPGTPDQQIQMEVTEVDHDLIVIGAEPDGRLRHWYLGEVVAPLLRWADRPLLIAR